MSYVSSDNTAELQQPFHWNIWMKHKIVLFSSVVTSILFDLEEILINQPQSTMIVTHIVEKLKKKDNF